MRVFEIRDEFGIDNLKLAERPEAALQPGQTRVRVKATSLNYRDLMTVKHGGARGARLPLIPLSDGAGEVVEVGPGVSRVQPGDRVMGIFMQTWLAGEPTQAHTQSALGGAIDGMLAEQVVLHEDGLVHVPDYLSYEEAATLPCAAVTAWQGLMTKGGMQAGDTILVLGTGGVSIFACNSPPSPVPKPSSPPAATPSWSAPNNSAPPSASTTRRRRIGNNGCWN